MGGRARWGGAQMPPAANAGCALIGRETFLAPHVPDRTISRIDVGIIDTVYCNTLVEHN